MKTRGEQRARRNAIAASSKESAMGKAETRRDAARAYGLLASQRNRKMVERRSKRDSPNYRPSSVQKSDRASTKVISLDSENPKLRTKKGEHTSTNAVVSDDREEVSESNSRVQAWLCETPILSMKGHFSFDDAVGIQRNKTSPSCTRTTIDKAMQTDVSILRSKSHPIIEAEYQTSLSDHTAASGYRTGHPSGDHKNGLPYDLTSSCSVEDTDRYAQQRNEECAILARIEQDLKETKESLLAERRVIQLKIEELKLRQEVRALMRDVSRAKYELKTLTSQEIQNPVIPEPPPSEAIDSEEIGSMPLTTEDLESKNTSSDDELIATDGGASQVFIKTGSDTTQTSENSPDPVNNTRPDVIEPSNETEAGHRVPPDLTPRRAEETICSSSCNSDLKEIKDHFVRHSELRSAPAVLFGLVQEDDYESHVKASSYDGVEMLSLCEIDIDDNQSKAIDEAIQRLAGGRIDLMEIDTEEPNDQESVIESEVLTISLDDEDEYINMLDSIPLNSTTPEAVLQPGEEETDLRLTVDAFESETQPENQNACCEIHLPFSSVFSEPPDEPEMNEMDLSASVVFCSPRNGRTSPRSPRRQLDIDVLKSPRSPDLDSIGDGGHSRHISAVDALITASSCSSCWVQFSQTDRDYIQTLIIKFLKAFCSPHPPGFLSSTDLPISLPVFTAIERENASSTVQEAFDRAIFDSVNLRLVHIYRCLGRYNVFDATWNEERAWHVPSYDCLLESVQRSVFATTDCDADPLAVCNSKEQIIEQMLKQDVHHLGKDASLPVFLTPPVHQ